MNEYKVAVTLQRTPPSPEAWTRQRYEFRFCAASWSDALRLASSNVSSQGFPQDEKQVQVLYATPCFAPRVAATPLKSCREMQIEQAEQEFEASLK
jgi:hypothetical protein